MNAAVNAPFPDKNCRGASNFHLTLSGEVWFIPYG
jgi:hypothetical protein